MGPQLLSAAAMYNKNKYTLGMSAMGVSTMASMQSQALNSATSIPQQVNSLAFS